MMKTFRGFEPLMVEVGQGIERLYKEADAAEAAARDSVGAWMTIAFALAVVLVFALSLLIGRSISKALASMVGAMTKLAGGDVKIAIPGLGRKDEIGEMAGAVEVFQSNMIEADRLRAEQSRGRAIAGRAAQGGHAQACRLRSRARSAKSSKPYLRPRPNWRPPPIR